MLPVSALAEGPDGEQIMEAYWQQRVRAETRHPAQYIVQDGRYIVLPEDRFGKLWEYRVPEQFFCEVAEGPAPVAPDYLCTVMLPRRDATVPNGKLSDEERIARLNLQEMREGRVEIPIVMSGDRAEVS